MWAYPHHRRDFWKSLSNKYSFYHTMYSPPTDIVTVKLERLMPHSFSHIIFSHRWLGIIMEDKKEKTTKSTATLLVMGASVEWACKRVIDKIGLPCYHVL